MNELEALQFTGTLLVIALSITGFVIGSNLVCILAIILAIRELLLMKAIGEPVSMCPQRRGEPDA